MALPENDILLIEKYIDEELTESDRELVRSRMKDDFFSGELKFQVTVARAFRKMHEHELKNELKGHLRHYNKGTRVISKPLPWATIYWAAAISAIVVASFLVLLQSDKNVAADTLFTAYYKAYPAAIVTRGHSHDLNNLAFQKYHNGEYATAAPLLAKLIEEGNDSYNESFLQLLLGNCYLNLHQVDKASTVFQKVMASDEKILAQHAHWYYTLALLKNHNLPQVLVELDNMINSNSIYSKQAQKLKEDLNKVD